jgi:hypothetical protein
MVSDPRAALEEHGTLHLTSVSRGGIGRAVHIDDECHKAGDDADDITTAGEIPLRAHVCKACDPDHEIDYSAGNNERDDVPAIEDHDDEEIVTDGGTDEIVAVSPATGNVYAVTEYRDVNDNGHIIAERKRLLTRYEVESELIHAAARRALRGGGRDD